MDDLDDDIQFDFFEDEPATQEAAPPRVRLPGRGPRPTTRRRVGPPRGTTPLLRLLGLVAFAVAVLLLFGVLIHSCAATSRHDSYASYMNAVDKIATQSSANGKALATALTTPGLSVTQLESKLRALADQEQQNVNAAAHLDPPGRLRPENVYLVEALQLRVNGLTGLADTFQSTAKSTDTTNDSTLLAAQAQRLVSSDVVWDDFFYSPDKTQLQHDNVSGVDVPESHYVPSTNPDLLGKQSMALVLERIRGASTGGGTPSGIHGTNLASVKAQPSGQVLTAGTLTTVTATTALAFDVDVHNGGNFQEVQIPVTLTIDRPASQGGPIVKTQTIQLIDPGQDQVVTFSNLGQVPFASQTTVKVDVATVPGETNKTNNSAQYPVIFSLP